MWPYGDTQPKAGLHLANTPLVRHQVEVLRAAGVKHVTVVVDHLGNTIRHYVADLKGVEVLAVSNSGGTVNSLLAAWDHLGKRAPDEILVAYGDLLFFEEDVAALLDRHDGQSGSATLLTGPMPGQDVMPHVGVTVKDGEVVGVRPRPRAAETRWTGVFAARKSFIELARTTPDRMTCLEVGLMPNDERDLAETMYQLVQRDKTIPSVQTSQPFVDLDKPWDILEGNATLLKYRSKRLTGSDIAKSATIDPTARIEGHLVAGENVVVGPGVILYGNTFIDDGAVVTDGAMVGKDSAIGRNAKVHRYCLIGAETSIGAECLVGHNAEFEGVMFRGAYSFHYGEYWGVLGINGDLGAATVCGNLRFDDLETIHRVKGRREIPATGANAVYFGDYTRTGVNATIMPGVKVGARSIVGAGVLCEKDVPNDTYLYVKQSLESRGWSADRYGA
jgi:bifunctional UDP-N-acetylglucosamine pyrophosphorylase/glucosamine-1-phosphate N-acetyltransferase